MSARRLTMRWRLATLVLRAADRFVRPRTSVILHSQPDLDDNLVALLRCVPIGLEHAVLVDDLPAARRRAAALGLGSVPLLARRSVRGTWRYLRAGAAVSTHGLFGSASRPGRHVVGLWHGEFGKLIGSFADEPTRHYDWMPVSSELSQSLRAAEFSMPRSRIGVVGSPRQDLLGQTAASPTDGRRRSVVWAPTFRRPSTGATRTDGDPAAARNELTPDDAELQALLRRHDATLWFRAHPADAAPLRGEGDRVQAADNAALEELGLTFYELLATADCFLTDYSSLWIDHLLCDRPMIAFCPDLEAYRSSRGLALEPHERWFPGPVTQTRADLLAALDAALGGDDEYAAKRSHLRGLLHTTPVGSPAARVWAHVQAALDGRQR